MKKILTINGSPVKNGSTEILLEKIVDGINEDFSGKIENKVICLNDFKILPCQACGENPEPDYCLYKDDIYPIYDYLINCDIILFGSPVYFDTVSAQSKLFIDRCNCLRPPNFETDSTRHFKKIISKKIVGAMALAGGQRGKFECARKVIAGFFEWLGVVNIGTVSYTSGAWKEAGSAINDKAVLDEACHLGQRISASLP
ncbi:MAG: flavodoxin family protein [candidate division Zixibacteria bacterium]|nr:flavodoxin family protein [candidate division Zixibacteria bacterium]